jgi:hypothetical protein
VTIVVQNKFIAHSCILDIFIALVTSAKEVGNTRIGASSEERVAKINEIAFYSLTSATWDDLMAASESIPSPSNSDYADMSIPTSGYNTPQNPTFEHPCSPLTKVNHLEHSMSVPNSCKTDFFVWILLFCY